MQFISFFGSNGGIVSIVSKVCYEHVFKIGKTISRHWDKFHPIHMFMDSILQWVKIVNNKAPTKVLVAKIGRETKSNDVFKSSKEFKIVDIIKTSSNFSY